MPSIHSLPPIARAAPIRPTSTFHPVRHVLEAAIHDAPIQQVASFESAAVVT